MHFPIDAKEGVKIDYSQQGEPKTNFTGSSRIEIGEDNSSPKIQ